MANDNCLEGIKCPKCGDEDRFFIESETLFEVTDDGAIPAENCDVNWDNESMTRCAACGHQAKLKCFRGHFWLLQVSGDVEPQAWQGPYHTYEETVEAAKKVRHMDGDLDDGLYWVESVTKPAEVLPFSGAALES